MTKIGHALPNAARKTLAASAYVGKGRIKDAVRVMKRKSIPKLEESIIDKIKKWNASGKKRSSYDGNDPYDVAPEQDYKKPMKKTIKENKAGNILKRVGDELARKTREYKEQNKKPKPVDDSSFKDMRQDDRKIPKSRRRLSEDQLQELTGKGKLFGLFKAGARAKLKSRIDKKQANFEKSAHENATKKKLNIDGVKKVYANLKTAERMQRMKDRITEESLDEGIAKKISRAFNKITGIQRAGLAHKTEKDYEDTANKADAYHGTYRHYEDRYGKSKKKFDKLSMDWYRGKREDRDKRLKDLDKRSARIENAGKLEEAISRRLIAKKNAEKQRSKYVKRKGELPPIMTPKNRHKFTDKEVNKIKSALEMQKGRRKEALDATMEKKKGYSNVPAPVQSRGTSLSTFSKPPTPGSPAGVHNAQPHVANLAKTPYIDPVRAHQKPDVRKPSTSGEDMIRGYNHWSTQYAQSGNPEHLDKAKKAALAHYAGMISKISHHPGHEEYDTARANAKSILDSHLHALHSIEEIVPKAPEKKKGLFRRLFRK